MLDPLCYATTTILCSVRHKKLIRDFSILFRNDLKFQHKFLHMSAICLQQWRSYIIFSIRASKSVCTENLPLRRSDRSTKRYQQTNRLCVHNECSTSKCPFRVSNQILVALVTHQALRKPFPFYPNVTMLRSGIYGRNFVCRLHSTQLVEIFGHVSMPFCSLSTRWPSCKILPR